MLSISELLEKINKTGIPFEVEIVEQTITASNSIDCQYTNNAQNMMSGIDYCSDCDCYCGVCDCL